MNTVEDALEDILSIRHALRLNTEYWEICRIINVCGYASFTYNIMGMHQCTWVSLTQTLYSESYTCTYQCQ